MTNQNTPLNEVRRKDRAVTDEAWIKDFLNKGAYGTLATSQEGQPFINTNLYVYDESHNAIYFHTSDKGRTHENVRANGRICFSVAKMGRLLPANTALNFSMEYASVVVFGRARLLEQQDEKAYGLQKLLDKYAPHLRPGRDYRPIQPEELAITTVYRIDIEVWSGKRKQVAEDFPMAYTWEQIIGQSNE